MNLVPVPQATRVTRMECVFFARFQELVASLLAVVVLQLLSDADSLREEAWVVGGAGEKTALL